VLLVATKLVIVLSVAFIVVAKMVPAVKPVLKFNVPELVFVATTFVIVLFVALTAPELILVVAKMVPAVNPVLKFNVPELVFVAIKFVTVLLVTTKFVIVLFVALTAPELILVVANMVPAVKPVLKFNVPELKFVAITFVTLLLVTTKLVIMLSVALSVDVLILVVAKIVPAVKPVLKFNVPELIFVAIKFVFNKLAIVPVVILALDDTIELDEIFVSTKLVLVIFTVVTVPPTNKLPLIRISPELIFVDNTLLTVPVLAFKVSDKKLPPVNLKLYNTLLDNVIIIILENKI
jgi:hypothetical protein